MSCKVSVIVPMWNAAGTIGRCLRSIEGQTLGGLEAVIVDDCSTDGSVEEAERTVSGFGKAVRYRILKTPVNLGPAGARNFGLKEAEGEYVAFLDADDTLEPTFCEKLFACGTDLAHCDIRIIAPDGSSAIKENPRESDKRKYLLRYKSFFTTYLYRRSLLRDCGIVFPDSRSAEDSCFLACAIMQAGSISGVEEALYNYFRDAGSVSLSRNRKRASWRLYSFRALRRYVREHRLPFRREALWLSLKKGFAMALKDILFG